MKKDNNYFSIKSTKFPFSGNHFNVSDGSTLTIGKDSEISHGICCIINSNYDVKHKLVIGDGVHIAREVLIRTSDGQVLIDKVTGEPLNPPKDIIIGDHVWIMSRCMIVKGSVIPNGCAVAACSFVNKSFNQENVLLGGVPAKILKQDIYWVEKTYNEYMNDFIAKEEV